MNKINNNGMSHEVVATYFGIRESEITNIVVKFVRRAIKEQDEIGVTTMTETFAAGADKYRITIEGAYNDLQNGGMKKTDYCFAKISFEIKGSNGRFVPYGDNWVRENGISHGTYVDSIYNAIFDYFADDLVIRASYDDYAKEIVALAEQQSDWDEFVDMCDRKEDIVSSYQSEIDGYVEDILMIAEKKSDIDFKMEAFAIREIVKKIAQTEKDCYDAITDAECDCFGTEIDLSALWNWENNYSQDYTDPCFDRECIDLGELIDTLDYMCGMEWDMPLAEDDVVESVAEDTPWLPMATPLYLDDAVIDYVSTYYHYAYCA